MPTQKNRCNRSGSFFATAVEAMRLEMVRIHILRLLGSLAAGAIRLNAPTDTFFAVSRLRECKETIAMGAVRFNASADTSIAVARYREY